MLQSRMRKRQCFPTVAHALALSAIDEFKPAGFGLEWNGSFLAACSISGAQLPFFRLLLIALEEAFIFPLFCCPT